MPLFREFVEGEWQSACYDRYRPSTRRSVRHLLRKQLLPKFGRLRLDRIHRTDIARWFDRYSETAPGGANQALWQLRQILNQAIARGHIKSNPARGIKPNPKRKPMRFLSNEEIRRVREALDACVIERPARQPAADIIRLLLLTGCRLGEIRQLRWSEVRDDGLHLIDAKTGPRRVFLNARARDILRDQPRTDSPYVFPSPCDPAKPLSPSFALWYLVRRRAGVEDARLHDLRHTFASHAVINGVPLPLVSRLLGHRDVSMTLRYAHVHDVEVEAAAERIGKAIARISETPDAREPASRDVPGGLLVRNSADR